MIKIKSLILGLTAVLGFGAAASNSHHHALHAETPLARSAKHYVPDRYDFVDYWGGAGDVNAAQGGGVTSFAHIAGQVPLKGDAIKVTSTLKLLSSRDVADGGDGVDGWITYSFSAQPGVEGNDKSYPYFGGGGSGYVFMFKNVSGTTAPNTAQLIFVQFENGVDTVIGTPFVDNMLTNTGVLTNAPISFDLELYKDNGAYTASIKNHVTGASLLEVPGLPLNESLFINELGQSFLSSAIYEGPGCDGNHWDHRGIMIHSFDAYTYDAADAVVTISPDVVYDGLSHRPSVSSVVVGDRTLINDVDYYVESSPITNVGSSTVRVNFINDFAGNAPIEKQFKVLPIDGAEAVVTLAAAEHAFTGSAIEPVVSSVVLGSSTLVEGTDYTISYVDNIAIGTGKVVVTFKGNYAGSVEKSFVIAPKGASEAVVTLAAGEFVFTGSAIEPVVSSVVLGDANLVAETDYTVSYLDNIAAGTGKVVVTFKGNYAGSVEKSFVISPKDASAAVVTLASVELEHTGSALEPAVSSVKLGEVALVAGTDYTVSYLNNTAVGTAKVIITFKGNYSGSVEKEFTIIAAPVDPGTSEPPISSEQPPSSQPGTSTPEETPKTGCFGNLESTIAMSFAIAALAGVLIIKRRKLV